MGAWHHLNTDQSGHWVDPEEHMANLKHSTDAIITHAGDMDEMWALKGHEASMPRSSGAHGAGILQSLMGGSPVYDPITMVYDPSAKPGDKSFRTSPVSRSMGTTG